MAFSLAISSGCLPSSERMNRVQSWRSVWSPRSTRKQLVANSGGCTIYRPIELSFHVLLGVLGDARQGVEVHGEADRSRPIRREQIWPLGGTRPNSSSLLSSLNHGRR